MLILTTAEARVIRKYASPMHVDKREPEKSVPSAIWKQCELLWRSRVPTDGRIHVLPVPHGPWDYRAILFRRLRPDNKNEFCTFVWRREVVSRRESIPLEIPLEEQLAALEAFAQYADAQESSTHIRGIFDRLLDRFAHRTAAIANEPLTAGISALLARTAVAHV